MRRVNISFLFPRYLYTAASLTSSSVLYGLRTLQLGLVTPFLGTTLTDCEHSNFMIRYYGTVQYSTYEHINIQESNVLPHYPPWSKHSPHTQRERLFDGH